MAFRTQDGSKVSTQGGNPPSTSHETSQSSSQGFIGAAGVKPSGIVERSGTIPTVSVIREVIRTSKGG